MACYVCRMKCIVFKNVTVEASSEEEARAKLMECDWQEELEMECYDWEIAGDIVRG